MTMAESGIGKCGAHFPERITAGRAHDQDIPRC